MDKIVAITINENKPADGWAVFYGVDGEAILVWAPFVILVRGAHGGSLIELSDKSSFWISDDPFSAVAALDVAHKKWLSLEADQ